MLNPDLSNALIEAGLDRIRISIQGLTDEDYQEVSNYKINFQQLINNIKYFYEKSKCVGAIYVKIMDAMLKNKQDEEKFKKLFSGICDSFNVETLVPLLENDISGLKQNFNKNYWGEELTETMMCPQPFYLLTVTPEGIVLPCCEEGVDLNIGKVSETNTIVDIWNGNKMKQIRSMMIQGNRDKHYICERCNVVKYQTSILDNLDAYAENLKELYNIDGDEF